MSLDLNLPWKWFTLVYTNMYQVHCNVCYDSWHWCNPCHQGMSMNEDEQFEAIKQVFFFWKEVWPEYCCHGKLEINFLATCWCLWSRMCIWICSEYGLASQTLCSEEAVCKLWNWPQAISGSNTVGNINPFQIACDSAIWLRCCCSTTCSSNFSGQGWLLRSQSEYSTRM